MARTFQTISPIDGSIYVEREYASALEIEKVMASTWAGQELWSKTSLEERTEICNKVIEYFVNNADEIGEEITRQMGRPIRYAHFEITKGFQERARYMIDIAETELSDIVVPKQIGFKKYIKKIPLGTVLVLAPWNYPFLTSVNAIIPAIMAGNSVILKTATQTPLCAERYAAAFEYAGCPHGVFQFLHTDHDQVARLISDKRIRYVAFTGSVQGGEAIQKAIGHRFINAGLELGGKDPAYVANDANVESAIENLVDGAFFNSGQSCCGIERIYVHEDQYDDFIHGFASLTKKYVLGNPMDQSTTLGPMVKINATNFVRNQLLQAINSGGTSLVKEKLFKKSEIGTPYLSPHVVINVNHKMELMSDETFGPAIGIMSVKSDEEAVSLMNDSQYGLTASIWTGDQERAEKIGNQIDTGTVFMNRCDYLDPALAWTGVKNSGRGCTLSSIGYQAFTRPKSFHLKNK